ncbi:RagB/SusD family nutrient uptake outer membrane protein [Gemmatimonas sp.]|uniref:RagB/SusD family nutrient uptake outer membrane protein n=1 Tax=Gemmatimonas sp. TaxID=1962908 RepID=UPI003340CE8B
MTMNLRAFARTAPVAALALAAGCDLKVTNPGPIQAQFLDTPAALTAVVNGAGRDLAEALNFTAYTGAAVTREVLPSGSTAAFGISVRQQLGVLSNDDGGDWWNQAQRARWTAENGVTRIKAILGTSAATSATLAQALVWAGFSNRHLAENFCDCVIDGGVKQPYTVYLERSEAAFTEAITVATAANSATIRDAATAGRASVRLLRGNLAGAAADAALIPSNAFVYRMPYYVNTVDEYNRIYWASANQPYRAHTVWGTFYENYRRTTRDPRVPFDSSLTIRFGDAAVTSLGGQVRWYFQTKYPVRESSINLSSGWEMRLIEAEALLVGGDINGALAKMNIRRTALSLPQLSATNATEAWVALKRERGIELWLEGRRLGDQRRWAALNRPGVSDDMTGRSLCFPIPLSELETNPNLRP